MSKSAFSTLAGFMLLCVRLHTAVGCPICLDGDGNVKKNLLCTGSNCGANIEDNNKSKV